VTTDPYAEVRPCEAGSVSTILVQSGAQVQAGDLLVQLDNASEKAALEEALRQAQKAEAELTRREAETAEQKRQRTEAIAVADLRMDSAVRHLARTQELMTKGWPRAAPLRMTN